MQGANRHAALKGIIEGNDHKTIVFLPFKHGLRGVYQYVCGYTTAAQISGDTPPKKRTEIFTAFQHTSSPRVLVAHPECMAHGLTLTAASTIVWYSPLSDLEIYEQANARIARASQRNPVSIIEIEGTAVERLVYKRLAEKRSFQGGLLELFSGVDDRQVA
jgi:SNF2 family DNA or RNA helicase